MPNINHQTKGFYGDPLVWGPHAWDFMLAVAMTYPDNPSEEIALRYKNFFTSLADILPCVVCREHYKINLSDLPIDAYLGNSKLLTKWVVQIHNTVNRKNNKKIVGFEEALKLFFERNKHKLNLDSKFKINYWLVAGISIPIILAIAYFYQNHQNQSSSSN